VIVPAETELTAPYWAAARRGAVMLQRCDGCGLLWHPPAPVCPRCRRTDWTWHPAEGTAVLVSWTRVTHAVHPQVAAALPYLVATVRLAEGPLFVCGLLPPADDAALVDGAPITIVPGPAAGGERLPMARLAARAAPGEAGRARHG
jgi:uncharacterized OB-fold protein